MENAPNNCAVRRALAAALRLNDSDASATISTSPSAPPRGGLQFPT